MPRRRGADDPGKSDWYSQKWGNRRASVRRAAKRAKYSPVQESASPETLSEGDVDAGSIARVAEVHRSFCIVMRNDEFIRCEFDLPELAGILAVGDRVVVRSVDDTYAIAGVLPRTSKLARARGDATRRSAHALVEHVVAANVDLAVIVAAAASPAFHPRFIDRYLVICQHGDVAPIICVNKCDLVATQPDLSDYASLGIPALHVSAESGFGLYRLRELLFGKYSVFVGHSGVGKSSLINRLIGQERLRVGEVRSKDGRGRHTTVASTLHKLADATYLIDTPGVRSLGLWGIDKGALQFYFPEIAAAAARCRFKNCSHTIEPGCAVKEAAEHGELSKARYDSYLRLMAE